MPPQQTLQLSMPASLVGQMKAAALDEGKSVDELTQTAVQKYLEDRQWRQLLDYGKQQAAKHGLKEDDVNDVIGQYRHHRAPE